MVLNYFSSFPFSCFSFLNIFVSLQDFSCWLHSFGLHFRKRKTIACNHPETDSLFHDLAFLSAWVPFKASCTRDHSSGQREICKPQELPSLLSQCVFSRCAKEEGNRDAWIKPFLELFPFEFSPYFHVTGKHRGVCLDWRKNSNCLQSIMTLTNHSISSLLLWKVQYQYQLRFEWNNTQEKLISC